MRNKHKNLSWKQDWSVYKRLIGYLDNQYWVLMLAMICNIIYSLVDAGLVKLLQPIMDSAFTEHDPNVIALIPIVLPLAFLLRGSMSFTASYAMSWLSTGVVMRLRRALFNHIQLLPMRELDHISSGKMLSKLTYNVEQVAAASTNVITSAIRSVVLIVALIGVMFWTSWQVSLYFLLVGPVIIAIYHLANKRFRYLSRHMQGKNADVLHVAEENLKNSTIVRLFGGESYEQKKFFEKTENTRRYQLKHALLNSLSTPVIQTVGGVAIALTIYFAVKGLFLTEPLTPGEFTVLVTSMLTMLQPIKVLTSISEKIQKGLSGAESVFEVLDLPVEKDTGTYEMQKAQGNIKFVNVSFAYNEENADVLRDVSFDIAAGDMVAFVGRSGSGKTTIINLLAHFYDHYTGEIMLDNKDIRSITLASLRKQISTVSQQVNLFNDTIGHNISYSDNEKNADAVYSAAKQAHALEFIEKTPLGFNSIVGEQGVLLSGGQRQRIAIARALYKKAPILILDEATSALDTRSEKIIQEALDNLTRQCTTLIIAHRLSTILKADKIIVMEQGQIVGSGKHDELLKNNDHYKQLYEAQYKKEITDQ